MSAGSRASWEAIPPGLGTSLGQGASRNDRGCVLVCEAADPVARRPLACEPAPPAGAGRPSEASEGGRLTDGPECGACGGCKRRGWGALGVGADGSLLLAGDSGDLCRPEGDLLGRPRVMERRALVFLVKSGY